MFRKLLALLLISFGSNAQNVPQFTATVYDSSSTGYYFLVPIKMGTNGGAFNPYHLILDGNGRVVYYKEFTNGLNTGDFKVQLNGLISYSYQNKFFLMDSTFTVVDSVSCKNGIIQDGHDMQILSNGHFLLLGSENITMDLSSYYLFNHNGSPGSQTATVKAGVIQELDANKNVLFEWHAIDYFSFTDIDTSRLNSPTTVDWTHFNAIEEDDDGNILLSTRHFNEITKIDRSNGNIIWRLGGKSNQFSFLNDPTMFIGQHDIRRIANGNITLLDNGDFGHSTSAKEYLLDEINHTAELVWSHSYNSVAFSGATGNAQRLPNGNTLIDFGNINGNVMQPAFQVVDSTGNLVFSITFADTLLSYRAFNYETLPWQLNRPQIACSQVGIQGYLDAGIGSSSYMWSTGETSQTILVNDTGEYSVYTPYGNGGTISSLPFAVHDISDPCNTLANIISENEMNQLEVFPNPTSSFVAIKNGKPGALYELRNTNGVFLWSGCCPDKIDFSNFSSGVYYLKSVIENTIQITKIVRMN